MKIAFAKTKNGTLAGLIPMGLDNAGIDNVTINGMGDLSKISKCDALITIAFNIGAGFRSKVVKVAKDSNIPVIFIDRGAFEDTNNINEIRYRSITINGPKALGIQYAQKFKNDNSRSIYIKGFEKPWIDIRDRDKISLLLHNPTGYFSSYQNDLDSQISKCKEKFGDRLIISGHPKYHIAQNIPMDQILKISKVCVGWHTNALCMAVIKGVPIMCLSDHCFAYQLSSKSVDDISLPNRDEWINMMSFTQWSFGEFSQGYMWPIILKDIL